LIRKLLGIQKTKSKVRSRAPRLATPDPALDALAQDILASILVKFPLPHEPTLEWRRMPVTAGIADYRRWVIGLSAIVLTDETRLRITLLHEFAHLLAVSRGGLKERGHGPMWQQAMRDVGLDPVVTHRYEVTRNQKRQEVIYRCAKCGHQFQKARRFPKGRVYLHRDCGGVLKMQEVIRKTVSDSLGQAGVDIPKQNVDRGR
jgi:predicted SprT family Zn-dependent metalloprotease